jgi:hypothetical protein
MWFGRTKNWVNLKSVYKSGLLLVAGDRTPLPLFSSLLTFPRFGGIFSPHEIYQNPHPLIGFYRCLPPLIQLALQGDPPPQKPPPGRSHSSTSRVLFGPARPPPNPTAPPFVGTQKRQRSDTRSPLPTIGEEIIRKFPRSNYWTPRMAQTIAEAGEDPTGNTSPNKVLTFCSLAF